MTALVIGLVIFLGVHSVRVFAEPLRTQLRGQIGENGYKGLYTLLSLAGFALVVWGFGQARAQPVPLWAPMLWARHLASLLMLVSFIFLAAAYVLDDETREQGEDEIAMLLDRYAFCAKAGEWPAFGDGYQLSGLPAWAKRSSEVEVSYVG